MKSRNLPCAVEAAFGDAPRSGVKLLTATRLLHDCHSLESSIPVAVKAGVSALSTMRFALHYYFSKLQIPDPNPSGFGGLGQS
jgi:hypothetical protein